MSDTLDSIVIQVTSKCPFSCPQCYAPKSNYNMSLQMAIATIDMATTYGIKVAQLTGGEPFVYPHLYELLRYCHTQGINTAIATSGFNNTVDNIVKAQKSGLDVVCVSLNGSDKIINDKTRNSFEYGLMALDNYEKCDMAFCINWVATHDNIEDLPNLRLLAKKHGALSINVLKLMPNQIGNQIENPSPNDLLKLAKIIEANKEDFVVESCFFELRSIIDCNTTVACTYQNDSIYVDCNGNISPCTMLRQYKYRSFADMLLSENEWRKHCCK